MKIVKKIITILFLLLLVTIWLYREDIIVAFNHFWYARLPSVSPTSQSYNSNDLTGSFEIFTFNSPSFGSRSANIYLPPGYNPDSPIRYPSFYLLHGFPGSKDDWSINAKIGNILDSLIKKNILPPLIVIFPDGNGPKNADSQYIDATSITQPMATHLVKELIPAIDAKYMTRNANSARAIGGLSSGGYGAINLALHYPQVFSYAISHSGYFLANDPTSKKLLGKDSLGYHDNSPQDRVSELVPLSIHIYLDAGKNDTKYLNETQNFADILSKEKVDYQFNIPDGHHTWGSWRANIQTSLTWLGEKMRNEGIW